MKFKKIAFIISIICFILVLPKFNFAQLTSGKSKVIGIVTDEETGEPIEGVTIKLFFPDVKQFHSPSPKTNEEGKWKCLYIRKGNWNIDFIKEGYETKKISAFITNLPGKKNTIEVQLRKMSGPAVADVIMNEIKKAGSLINEKKYDEALSKLQAIKDKYKDETGIEFANLYIGNIYSVKNDYSKAIEFYLKSLEKFPDNKEIILSIGNAYNNMKDMANAQKWFNKLKIDDINNADTLYNIGVIAYNNGDFKRAATFFKKSTEVNTEFADGFYQLGMTYVALEKNQDGVTALKRFMELAPNSPNYEAAKAVVEAFKSN